MAEERLPTHLWLDAMIRDLSARHIGVYVVRRGDAAGGLVLVKIANLAGQCRLLMQQRDLDGKMGWVAALREEVTDEKSADDYIARASNRDPDLWVVEIEDKAMNNPF